jgi:hypothetical protein
MNNELIKVWTKVVDTIPEFARSNCEEPQNASVRIAGVPTALVARHLPNSSQKCYRLSELARCRYEILVIPR